MVEVRKAIDVNNKRFPSPLQNIAERFQTIQLHKLETIKPFCLAPWQQVVETCIPERKEAEQWI